MIAIIYIFWNFIIKFLFLTHNMDKKKSLNESNDIENNKINAQIRCYFCFSIIKNDRQIYCLLDNMFCSNNCRLQYIKHNRIII